MTDFLRVRRSSGGNSNLRLIGLRGLNSGLNSAKPKMRTCFVSLSKENHKISDKNGNSERLFKLRKCFNLICAGASFGGSCRFFDCSL